MFYRTKGWPGTVSHLVLGAAGTLLLAVVPAPAAPNRDAHAAVLILKDGFQIQGYVKQESELIVDPYSHIPISIPRGHIYLDDIVRRFFFSHHYLEDTQKRPFDLGKELRSPRTIRFLNGRLLPPIREVLEVGEWDSSWDRLYQFRSPKGRVQLTQHLSVLSPHYTWVDALPKNNNFVWGSAYRTGELGPQVVASLLAIHPDLADKPDLTPAQRADRHFQVFNFFVQGGWLDEAQKELTSITQAFPGEKEKIGTAAANLKKLLAFRNLDEIRLAQATGKHQALKQLLARFPVEGADPKVLYEIRSLSERYADAEATLKRARGLLDKLPGLLPRGQERQFFTEAATAIAAELTYDHVLRSSDQRERGRLELFLRQADRSEQLQKTGKGVVNPGELLALAVSGWLLGTPSAETKIDSARRLWRGRQLVLEYQRTHHRESRQKLLADYMQQSGISVEETAQLIGQLPPPEMAEMAAGQPQEIKAPPLSGLGRGVTYQLQLPPEYHFARSYPVLIVLPHSGENGKDMIQRWGERATRQGYILAAPEWALEPGGSYHYSAEEHAAVLDTLRHLRHHFNVDSDRVFLSGFGEGGNMAYDVGLAHPALFAGVLPIAGQPRFHACRYWPNSQYLPFYIVWGERMGLPEDSTVDGNKANTLMFREWIPAGHPVLGIQYKGRGLEWFGGELADAFDWMNRKKRAHPQTALGRDTNGQASGGGEFRTQRSCDNHFYWLSTEALAKGYLNEGPRATWDWRRSEAMLCGQITEGNNIGVRTHGLRQVSIWLARGMVDFEKPITVRINFGVPIGWSNRKILPSLETLLEDLYQRGDRQRLYIARLDFRL